MPSFAAAAIIRTIAGGGRMDYADAIWPLMARHHHVRSTVIGGRHTAMFDPDYDPETDERNLLPCEHCNGTGVYTYAGYDDEREPCHQCTASYEARRSARNRLFWYSDREHGYWNEVEGEWGTVQWATLYPQPRQTQSQRRMLAPWAPPAGAPDSGRWVWAKSSTPGRMLIPSSRWVHGRDFLPTDDALSLRPRITDGPLALLAPDGAWHEASERLPWRGRGRWPTKFWSFLASHSVDHTLVVLECTAS